MTKDQKIIKGKVGLLELAKQLGNVSQACKMLGYSRDSFYRFSKPAPSREQRNGLQNARYVPKNASRLRPVRREHRNRGNLTLRKMRRIATEASEINGDQHKNAGFPAASLRCSVLNRPGPRGGPS